ncbi:MAG: hypothetical protein KF684_04260 [Phycisphaeraceae bacterium]|nr:hypothetical protein [Phycisphaeraceae bacterium]
MSEITLPLPMAQKVAEIALERLAPHTTRRLVAGSVRRGKPEVSDIDLVLEPRYDTDLGGRFDGWTAGFLASVRDCELWTLDSSLTPTSRGVTVRSRKNPALKIELWLCFPWNYGWISLLRTGPSDFTRDLVTLVGMDRLGSAPGGGYRFKDGLLKFKGEMVRCPHEETVFEELGLPFVEPRQRSPAFLRTHEERQAREWKAMA